MRIDVPDSAWKAREALAIDELPVAWSAIPAGRASVEIGSKWLAANRSPILLVPSVIVPEEQVVLLNPLHSTAGAFTAHVARIFDYEKLFRGRAADR